LVILVIDSTNRQPVDAAECRVAGTSEGDSPVFTADTSGRILVADLPPGEPVTCVVSAVGYDTHEEVFTLAGRLETRTVILEPSGSVSGIVVTGDGAPVPSATVVLEGAGEERVAVTDSAGAFRIAAPAGGADLTLSAMKTGYSPVTRAVPRNPGPQILRLERIGTATVTLFFPRLSATTGRPTIVVEASGSGLRYERQHLAVQNGRALLKLTADVPRWMEIGVLLPSGPVRKHIAMEPPAEGESDVYGFVALPEVFPLRFLFVRGGAPLRSANVDARFPDGKLCQYVTDADGESTLLFADAPDIPIVGHRTVTFMDAYGVSAPIAVQTGTPEPVVVDLGLGGSTVMVIADDTIAGDRLDLENADTRFIHKAVSNTMTFRVPPGTYRVRLDRVPIGGAGVSIAEGESRTLDIRPLLAFGTLTGRLASPGEVRLWSVVGGTQVPLPPVRTQGLTSFSVGGLVPGEYIVAVWYEDGSYFTRRTNLPPGQSIDLGLLADPRWSNVSIRVENAPDLQESLQVSLLPPGQYARQFRGESEGKLYAPPDADMFVGIPTGFGLIHRVGGQADLRVQVPVAKPSVRLTLPPVSQECTQLLWCAIGDSAVWFLEVPMVGRGEFLVPFAPSRQYYCAAGPLGSEWLSAVLVADNSHAIASTGRPQEVGAPKGSRWSLRIAEIAGKAVEALEWQASSGTVGAAGVVTLRLPDGIIGGLDCRNAAGHVIHSTRIIGR